MSQVGSIPTRFRQIKKSFEPLRIQGFYYFMSFVSSDVQIEWVKDRFLPFFYPLMN